MKGNIILAIVIIILVVVAGFYFWQLHPETIEERAVTIGIARWVSNPEYDRNIQGFKDGLAENGYIDGEKVTFIIRNPETDKEKQIEIIQSFIDDKVDLIYSLTTPGALIAKEMVKDIPIVFSIVTFPVEAGIIESIESSGNNFVGTRNYVAVERQYRQFEKVFSNTKTLAFVHRKGEPNSMIQHNDMKKLLAKKGVEVIDVAAQDLDDMRSQLLNIIDTVDAIFSACDTLIQGGGEKIVIEFSREHKKPSFTCNKDGVLKGALMGNVADFYVIGKISGRQAALILGGAKPSSLLTESPAEDYLIINTKTAQAIGVTIPQYVLDDAEEIIEQ